MYCTTKLGRQTASSLRLISTLIPLHPITHCLIQYTTLVCLHISADNNALTQALHTLMSLNFGIAKVICRRLAPIAHTLHRWLIRGLVISAFTSTIT